MVFPPHFKKEGEIPCKLEEGYNKYTVVSNHARLSPTPWCPTDLEVDDVRLAVERTTLELPAGSYLRHHDAFPRPLQHFVHYFLCVREDYMNVTLSVSKNQMQ